MIFKVITHGVFDTNCYFLIDDKTSHGFLIDCGAEADKIIQIIKENNWFIEGIFITHGHFDHIGALMEVKQKLDVPVYGHKDKIIRSNPNLNLSSYYSPFEISDVISVKDGQFIKLKENSEFYIKVIETPGHTPDSLTFYCEKENVAFVGDTIFLNSPGSYEFPLGNSKELFKSIKKILELKDDTYLLSGHSKPTTVNHELENYKHVLKI